MSAALAALQAIEAANLTDKQYRVARRLLDAGYATGHLVITRAEAQNICTTSTEGATRRLLGQLKAAELIRYRINGHVYIDFMAYGPGEGAEPRSLSDHPRANIARGRAESDHPRAESDLDGPDEDAEPRSLSDHPRANIARGRAESDRPRAGNARNCFPTYTHARPLVGWLVDQLEDQQENQPTNPATTTTPAIDPVEQAIAFGLLRSSGIAATNAKQLSEVCDLATVRRAVGHWWNNRNGDFRSPGIVVSWLRNPESAGIPECSDAFRRSPLYRQWRTRAEIAAEQAAEVEALARLQEYSPQQTGPIEDDPTQGPLDLLWAEVQQGYALSAPAILDTWLSRTRLSEIGEECAVIMAPPRQAEYIQNRLATSIRRELALRGHRPQKIIVRGDNHGDDQRGASDGADGDN